MRTAVNDLVSMHDIQSLVELMDESEDWLDQMDAAEGLVRLGDRRGLQYLLVARQGDIEDVRDAVKEILTDPVIQRMRGQIESEQRHASRKLLESARVRLKNGKKVFLHKVIYLPAGALVHEEDQAGDTNKGFEIYELNDAGLEGWEVVNVISQRQMTGPGENTSTGVYVFLKKELRPDETDELEK